MLSFCLRIDFVKLRPKPAFGLMRFFASASFLPNPGQNLRLDRCGILFAHHFSRKPEASFSRVMFSFAEMM